MSAALDRVDRTFAREALERELEERIAAGRLALPILPQVATRILSGGLDDGTDLRTLSDLLHRDQSLTGNVLRVANSALYGSGVRVQSIQQALTRIGLVQMREIVLALTVERGIFRAPGREALVAELWTHSAIAGIYAKEVARRLRANVEGAFVCGLLHDVGKVIVLAAVLDAAAAARAAVADAVCREVTTAYHTRLGALLAERWALPEPVLDAIAHHHATGDLGAHASAVQITVLADRLAHAALAPDESAAEVAAALQAHPVCAALNLYPDDVEALLARRAEMRALAEAFAS
jgi:putative nucleotidyltransferase with HDIG domain